MGAGFRRLRHSWDLRAEYLEISRGRPRTPPAGAAVCFALTVSGRRLSPPLAGEASQPSTLSLINYSDVTW